MRIRRSFRYGVISIYRSMNLMEVGRLMIVDYLIGLLSKYVFSSLLSAPFPFLLLLSSLSVLVKDST